MIGGTGERVLRLTARFADDWNAWLVFGRSRAEELAPQSAKVDAACTAAGRIPSTLTRSAAVRVATQSVRPSVYHRARDLAARGLGVASSPLSGSAEAIAEGLMRFKAQGVSHLQIYLDGELEPALEDFGRVLEALDRADSGQNPTAGE
jgi:alkanesulfonate monooxygenase SsuD/methylene tetrahydromethanopterin reductase-like flavin-dependent oxidoreductase (luciferase family)